MEKFVFSDVRTLMMFELGNGLTDWLLVSQRWTGESNNNGDAVAIAAASSIKKSTLLAGIGRLAIASVSSLGNHLRASCTKSTMQNYHSSSSSSSIRQLQCDRQAGGEQRECQFCSLGHQFWLLLKLAATHLV